MSPMEWLKAIAHETVCVILESAIYVTSTPAERDARDAARRRGLNDALFSWWDDADERGDDEQAANLLASIEKYERKFPGEWARPLRKRERRALREQRRAKERLALLPASRRIVAHHGVTKDGVVIHDVCPRCGTRTKLRACFDGLVLCYPCYFDW